VAKYKNLDNKKMDNSLIYIGDVRVSETQSVIELCSYGTVLSCCDVTGCILSRMRCEEIMICTYYYTSTIHIATCLFCCFMTENSLFKTVEKLGIFVSLP
jgi:hypothetical protein